MLLLVVSMVAVRTKQSISSLVGFKGSEREVDRQGECFRFTRNGEADLTISHEQRYQIGALTVACGVGSSRYMRRNWYASPCYLTQELFSLLCNCLRSYLCRLVALSMHSTACYERRRWFIMKADNIHENKTPSSDNDEECVASLSLPY